MSILEKGFLAWFLVLFVARAVAGGQAKADAWVSNPAIGQVLTMLENIVTMVETEGQTDQEEHDTFVKWEEGERSSTTAHVGTLQTEIETTQAALADLRSQKVELDATVTKIKSDLNDETTQLNAATTKRQEENSAFVSDQQNFDNAITACAQAVNILKAHYGAGEKEELAKPDFISLIHKSIVTVRKAADKVKSKNRIALALIQDVAKGPNFNTYQASSDESSNIVDQVVELSETFGEDKQSAIQQERQLQSAFETLRDQKQLLIKTLTEERDSQQSQLDGANQSIAENEGSLQMAQQTLSDKQAYLATLAEQRTAANAAFAARSADRKAEKTAVKEAIGVLEKVSFLQQVSSIRSIRTASVGAGRKVANLGQGKAWALRMAARSRGAHMSNLLRVSRMGCKNCYKAAALLREKATSLRSHTLASAALFAGLSNSQLKDVISRLEGLIRNLNAEQHTETEHKEWCEDEVSKAAQKRTGHQNAAEDLQQTINSLVELISMKQTELNENQDDIDTENGSWEQQTQIRDTDKREYDEDLQDTMDAIAAMNEAIDILAGFYASRKKAASASLLQLASKTDPEKGSQVVELMRTTRKEFGTAESELRKVEQDAVAAFAVVRADHIQADNDLQHARGVVTVEKQTAEQALASNRKDLASNNAEIVAVNAYLHRLGLSCQPLLDNYDHRVELRAEEKTAIESAIKVLEEV